MVLGNRGRRPQRAEWGQFTPIELAPNGAWVRVRCKHCHYTGSAHASRLARHYALYHAKGNQPDAEQQAEPTNDEPEPEHEADVNAEPPAKKARQSAITEFGLVKVSIGTQRHAGRTIAEMQVSLLQLFTFINVTPLHRCDTA
jgi:hypothetical protein